MICPGERYLITTDGWFFAPDGQSYCAAFGTVRAVRTTEDTFGVKANRGATNWYLEIGGLVIAGCRIHYAVRTDAVDFAARPIREIDHEGQCHVVEGSMTRIYDADGGAAR